MKRSALLLASWSVGCSVYTPDLLVGTEEDQRAEPAGASGGLTGAGAAPSGGATASTGGETGASGGASPGTGGTAASAGGEQGMGGAPGGADPCDARAGETSLADFEAGTTVLTELEGRSGSWFLFNDGSGVQTPEKPGSGPMLASGSGACGSTHSFETTGTGFSGWGAGIGVDLVPKAGGIKQPHDLSAYGGFAFFARADAPLVVRVSVSDANTADEGGVCDPSAGSGDPDRCGDYFGKDLLIATEWTRLEVSFDEMTQRGFGLAVAEGFDAAAAYSFRFQTGGGADFALFVDEITLVPSL